MSWACSQNRDLNWLQSRHIDHNISRRGKGIKKPYHPLKSTGSSAGGVNSNKKIKRRKNPRH